jgi:hypothetical protein
MPAPPVVATDIAEGCLPELRLTLQIIDAQNDRADCGALLAILSAAFDGTDVQATFPNTGASHGRFGTETGARSGWSLEPSGDEGAPDACGITGSRW